MNDPQDILFYDGYCGFCNRMVLFVLERDKSLHFKFAPLKGKTAWTRGSWRFSKNEIVPWNRLQNVRRHIVSLAEFLLKQIKGRRKATAKKGARKRGR